METPAGATPEESQADAMPEPVAGEAPEMSLEDLLGDEDEEEKPFGDEQITEDEAVNMDKK